MRSPPTLTARCGAPGAFKQVKVRLAAIGASESHQPFKQRSKQELSGLCYLEQAQIWPRDIDRYGRTVADVRCRAEGAGRHQVAAGLAAVYERHATREEALVKCSTPPGAACGPVDRDRPHGVLGAANGRSTVVGELRRSLHRHRLRGKSTNEKAATCSSRHTPGRRRWPWSRRSSSTTNSGRRCRRC